MIGVHSRAALAVFASLLALGMGCNPDEVTYSDLNDADNCLEVEVGPDAQGQSAPVDVTRAGGSDVGDFWVEPASGPVGTLHRFVVELDGDFDAVVDRVLVETDNNFDTGDGGVGPLLFEMEAVPGAASTYDLPLESGGESGDTRTDTFCVIAQQIVDN